MVKLIIRDDDCNFFTRPEDIEKVYSAISSVPVSFAVVPYVTDVNGGCPETNGNTTPMPIGENQELVSFLKERVQNNKCDILIHGITHGYQNDASVDKIPEMIWRENEANLVEKIGDCKTSFEKLFGVKMTCFVAPSNHIRKNGIKAVYQNRLNYSGIIPIGFHREINVQSICNYVKRMTVRAVKGLPYPGVLTYKTHKELNACNTTNYDYLRKMFSYCQVLNSPMAINVHYWHIRDNYDHYKGFFDFVKYAIDNGAVPSLMRDCL